MNSTPARIVAVAAADRKLFGSDLRVCCILAEAAERGEPAPSQWEIAERLGQKSRGPVARAMKRLAERGYLTKDEGIAWLRMPDAVRR